MKTCANCNLFYDDEKKFCKKCGAPLTSEYQIKPKEAAKKSVFEDRLRADPLNIEILHEYAQFLFNNQIFKETITVSFKILAIKEEDGVAKELLFKSYFKLNMLKETLDIGKQLLAEKPMDIFLLQELAGISSKIGNSGLATEYFNRILNLQPANAAALFNKAQNFLGENQVEKAIEIFTNLHKDGQNDRITTIYTAIDKALNADYKSAIKLLTPILSDRRPDQNDINMNRGILYLAFSLCETSAGLTEIKKWAAKINLKSLKQNYLPIEEQTVVIITEFIVNQSLSEIASSSNAHYEFSKLTEAYLANYYFTANSHSKIAELWYTVGNKQAEAKLFLDAAGSYQKAIDLHPSESRYQQKCAECKKIVEDTDSARSKKTKKMVVTSLVSLAIVAVLFFAYSSFRDKASWNEAKSLNSLDGYNAYLSAHPKGAYSKDANDNIQSQMCGLVIIKGGTFSMGSNEGLADEKPVHTVTLSDFDIGKYEVTQAQWESVMGNNPSKFKGANLPVEQVSWNDVQEFLRKLNTLTGKTYRLPTEAEWEYAAGGGGIETRSIASLRWAGTNSESSLGNFAWFAVNSNNATHPVGSKQPNALGLYDMSGNVFEWCSDLYGEYNSNAQINPAGASSNSSRVFRGGSWSYNASLCGVAFRASNSPDFRSSILGFRLVLVP